MHVSKLCTRNLNANHMDDANHMGNSSFVTVMR